MEENKIGVKKISKKSREIRKKAKIEDAKRAGIKDEKILANIL